MRVMMSGLCYDDNNIAFRWKYLRVAAFTRDFAGFDGENVTRAT
jgi:hypothetical protein